MAGSVRDNGNCLVFLLEVVCPQLSVATEIVGEALFSVVTKVSEQVCGSPTLHYPPDGVVQVVVRVIEEGILKEESPSIDGKIQREHVASLTSTWADGHQVGGAGGGTAGGSLGGEGAQVSCGGHFVRYYSRDCSLGKNNCVCCGEL